MKKLLSLFILPILCHASPLYIVDYSGFHKFNEVTRKNLINLVMRHRGDTVEDLTDLYEESGFCHSYARHLAIEYYDKMIGNLIAIDEKLKQEEEDE